MEVHFQPLLEVASQRIVGAEALVRWHDPERGQVAPAEFIPVAEHAGLIGDLGARVLRAACARAVRWQGQGQAVNLSPEQVWRPGLVGLVRRILADTGPPPDRLELEITEGVLLQETAATLVTLADLRALGVRIVLDDFGTGYSSLSHLRRFPFSKLKIDRSFIAGIGAEPGAVAIVRAIATLGHSLGMRVKAEGVETSAQLLALRELGCDEAQGYLLGRPCPAPVFEQMVEADRWRRA